MRNNRYKRARVGFYFDRMSCHHLHCNVEFVSISGSGRVLTVRCGNGDPVKVLLPVRLEFPFPTVSDGRFDLGVVKVTPEERAIFGLDFRMAEQKAIPAESVAYDSHAGYVNMFHHTHHDRKRRSGK